MPEHVIPIRMRRETCHNGLAQLAKVVREACHFIARDPGVDEQHAGPTLHDRGVVLEYPLWWTSTPFATCVSMGVPSACGLQPPVEDGSPGDREFDLEQEQRLGAGRAGRAPRISPESLPEGLAHQRLSFEHMFDYTCRMLPSPRRPRSERHPRRSRGRAAPAAAGRGRRSGAGAERADLHSAEPYVDVPGGDSVPHRLGGDGTPAVKVCVWSSRSASPGASTPWPPARWWPTR